MAISSRPNGVSSPSLFLPSSHLLSHFLMWDFCFSFTILIALLLDSGVFCPDTHSQPHFTALFHSFPRIWFSPWALCTDFLPSSQENLWLESCCTTAYIGKPGEWGCGGGEESGMCHVAVELLVGLPRGNALHMMGRINAGFKVKSEMEI